MMLTKCFKILLYSAFFIAIGNSFSGCKKKKKENTVLLESGTVSDKQGNIYATIKIGEQWWMAENLRVTVYNDSTPITEVKYSDPDSVWANKQEGVYCQLDTRYGLHYNWYAVIQTKKIAPIGWHIPSDEEWKQLEKELGMSQLEADQTSWRGNNECEKLIPEASVGWPSTSTIFGTNESGFSALPGGCKLFNGTNGEISKSAFWWTATSKTKELAWYRNISSSNTNVFRYFADNNYGLNIRCVKD